MDGRIGQVIGVRVRGRDRGRGARDWEDRCVRGMTPPPHTHTPGEALHSRFEAEGDWVQSSRNSFDKIFSVMQVQLDTKSAEIDR